MECLSDASLHLDLTFVTLVSGHPRPPVVTAPVFTVGLLAGTHWGASDAQDGTGSRTPTLVVALCWWWWTCHVDVAPTRVRQAHLLDS